MKKNYCEICGIISNNPNVKSKFKKLYELDICKECDGLIEEFPEMVIQKAETHITWLNESSKRLKEFIEQVKNRQL